MKIHATYKRPTLTLASLALISVSALGGCSGGPAALKNSLGLDKKAPDEFSVVRRAPLAMPPGVVLPPPTPGAPRPQEKSATDQAKRAIFGEKVAETSGQKIQSTSENVLLQKAGAQNPDPAIRQRVDSETQILRERNKPVIKKLLGLAGNNSVEPVANVVDAPKEAERLKKNAAQGKPVTEGETPSLQE